MDGQILGLPLRKNSHQTPRNQIFANKPVRQHGNAKPGAHGLSELAPLGIFATTVEPGFFRTDFLDAKSLTTAPHSIPDYAETVGAMRTAMADANHQQPNNPEKVGPAMLALVNAKNPPVRLPLGRDTVEAIQHP